MKIAIACLFSCVVTSTAAAAWPEKPINLVVPFPAGAGTDLTARTIAACMQSKIKDSRFVVLNKPGAAGDIGLSFLAQAEPDGYTIGIINTPGIVSLPIERKRNYTLESFDFIANLVEDPGTISVHAESAIHTVDDLVSEAKKNPGRISVGTQGVGSAGHIAALLIEQAADIKTAPIPFQGTSPASIALLGKVIDSTTANLGEAITFANGKPWRIVGVMSDQRSTEAPDVPTFKEAGYAVYAGSMRGLAAPRGVPQPIMNVYADAVEQCNQDMDYLERTKNSFQPLRYLKRDEYVERLNALDVQLKQLWQENPWLQ